MQGYHFRAPGLEHLAELADKNGELRETGLLCVKAELAEQKCEPLRELVLDTMCCGELGAISNLGTASPRMRVNLGVLRKSCPCTTNTRESYYGESSELGSEDSSVSDETQIGAAFTTDLELSYQWKKAWSVSVGANNLSNTYPTEVNGLALKEWQKKRPELFVKRVYDQTGLDIY